MRGDELLVQPSSLSIAGSLVVITAMWNPIRAPGPVALSVRALLADIGLTAAMLMPWGDRLLGAH